MSFFVRTSAPEDWHLQLAEPNKHWKNGYSAKTLAYCWMNSKGFPKSIKQAFQNSKHSVFRDMEFLAGFVEHKVTLPGGGHPSQNDIFVLAKSKKNLVAIVVEGKVSEPFGEIVGDWVRGGSKGKRLRLNFLKELLGLEYGSLHEIRYQLVHRAASAVIEARRFNAATALMIVHSFSSTHEWFDDYKKFASLFGIKARLNAIHEAKRIDDIDVYLAWITDEKNV